MNLRLRILPLLMVAMFASCAAVKNEQMSKNAFSQYEIVQNNQIMWSEIFKQKEDHYLVFFYAETCDHCHQIMGDVTSFADQNIVPIYFLNTKEQDIKIPLKNEVELTIGISSEDDLFIAGSPNIIEIENHIVKNNIPGKDDCLTLLNSLRMSTRI